MFVLSYKQMRDFMEIRKVEPVLKTSLDLKKDREKQNEEKRRALLEKKRLLEELKKLEGKGTRFDKRI